MLHCASHDYIMFFDDNGFDHEIIRIDPTDAALLLDYSHITAKQHACIYMLHVHKWIPICCNRLEIVPTKIFQQIWTNMSCPYVYFLADKWQKLAKVAERVSVCVTIKVKISIFGKAAIFNQFNDFHIQQTLPFFHRSMRCAVNKHQNTSTNLLRLRIWWHHQSLTRGCSEFSLCQLKKHFHCYLQF